MPTMTYHELAEAHGITLDSARRLARKKRWAKVPGNDGLARVAVPDDEAGPRDRPQASPKARPKAEGATALQEIRDALLAEVARLRDERVALQASLVDERRRADFAEAGRDAARAEAEAVVAEVKERLDEIRADRDRWHALATRPWWKRLAG